MNYSRYKFEHVADHLREEIESGKLKNPLPSLRGWSSAMGVSIGTLHTALKILKREGWIDSKPKKGFFLRRMPKKRTPASPLVRWIIFDPKHQISHAADDLLMAFSQKLSVHHIAFQIEHCDNARLKAIHRAGPCLQEMLICTNLSVGYQRMFDGFKNVLVIGLPLPGIRLPYISSDVFPAMRHATYRLLRLGCRRIDLLNVIGRRVSESIGRLDDEFQKIRAEAPHAFDGEVVWLPSDLDGQSQFFLKLASRIRAKHGFVVNAPLSPALMIMALTSAGLRIPDQFEILPVNFTPSQLVTYPQLGFYPFPLEQISKTAVKMAVHFFESGAVPEIHKNVPMELVLP